jgi:anti-sigma B factor antagonist
MNAQSSRLVIGAQAGWLTVSGVVDSHTGSQLLDAIRSHGDSGDVELDLSAVEFIDSSGLRIIVTAHRELDAAGRELVVLQASEAVTRLLEITGLTDHLHIR